MKAIMVHFTIGDVKHTFTASDGDKNSVRRERDNSIQFEENYDAAARALCAKMGWTGTLVKGFVRGCARVYVWLADDAKLDVQPHPHVGLGRCSVCGHYGDNCTGLKSL